MKPALSVLLLLMTSMAQADWTPPADPDPQAILQEAQDDTRAERYEDALAKHVWFHENALKLRPSLYGVRLSFALSYWRELGKAYAPALIKLQSIRDEAGKNVREGHGAKEAFRDFAAINKTLGQEVMTKDLFVWLDSHKPEAAEDAFNTAEPALVRTKEYHVCDHYLKADESYQASLRSFQRNQQLATDPQFGGRLGDFGKKKFSNEVTILVALLVVNDRRAQAESIVAAAVKDWDNPQFKEQLDQALGGVVPEPWP